jgi:hypothetical protein
MAKIKQIEVLNHHHRDLEKILDNMEDMIENLELGGEEMFQMHYLQLEKLRIRILTKSMLHFLQEEQVLFPEIIKLKTTYKLKVRELLKQHVEIKKVYGAIVEAIELEDHKALLQWAKQAVAILRKHIKVEDKFFNAVQQKGITPTVARKINLKLEEYNRAVG